jgi:hypothetical protein
MTSARQEFNKILLQKWNGNKTRLCQETYPKLMLNKLKVMRNFTYIYTLWASSSRKFIKKLPIYMWPKCAHAWITSELKPNYKLYISLLQVMDEHSNDWSPWHWHLWHSGHSEMFKPPLIVILSHEKMWIPCCILCFDPITHIRAHHYVKTTTNSMLM